ncbi:unnamed protein product [Paramecium octaurelia]|uniref:Uncharacterized protein n=1 Tax=Paramecium octaurelia TaxID=43137 RepID=A0A8S1XF18_PAROT|nr:unnamed protein product [Paramecium octaurelia]
MKKDLKNRLVFQGKIEIFTQIFTKSIIRVDNSITIINQFWISRYLIYISQIISNHLQLILMNNISSGIEVQDAQIINISLRKITLSIAITIELHLLDIYNNRFRIQAKKKQSSWLKRAKEKEVKQ